MQRLANAPHIKIPEELEEGQSSGELRVRVRNTFIEAGLTRSPSLEAFYSERVVSSCPGSRHNCLIGLNFDEDAEVEKRSACTTAATPTPVPASPRSEEPRTPSPVAARWRHAGCFRWLASNPDPHIADAVEGLCTRPDHGNMTADLEEDDFACSNHRGAIADVVEGALSCPDRQNAIANTEEGAMDRSDYGSTIADIVEGALARPDHGITVSPWQPVPSELQMSWGCPGAMPVAFAFEPFQRDLAADSLPTPDPNVAAIGGHALGCQPRPNLATVALGSRDGSSRPMPGNIFDAISSRTAGRMLKPEPTATSACSRRKTVSLADSLLVNPAAACASGLPSAGSALHETGRCKPCAFVHSKGCDSGVRCEFCHVCEPGEKKRRQRDKLKSRKATFKRRQGFAGDEDNF